MSCWLCSILLLYHREKAGECPRINAKRLFLHRTRTGLGGILAFVPIIVPYLRSNFAENDDAAP